MAFLVTRRFLLNCQVCSNYFVPFQNMFNESLVHMPFHLRLQNLFHESSSHICHK